MPSDTDPLERHHGTLIIIVASLLFIWYLIVVGISITGAIVVRLKNTQVKKPVQYIDEQEQEGVTILRPLKGIDSEMEACLSSALQQQYTNFEVIFCVESEGDAAIAVARSLIERYPDVDAKIMVSGEDEHYGPNPKINNLAKGYMAAKYDIIWVLDSNAWVSQGALARSVALLNSNSRVQLVHHLPMSISLDAGISQGAKLDEMFMLTSHSKFYSAINTLAIEPCVMGKSNMYRRSVLDAAVAAKLGAKAGVAEGTGIQNFAQYIAEDNMIAKCIWEHCGGRGVTAMTCDSVVQPLSNFSMNGYWSRRVRWLRVRRFMVHAATLVEPTTESFVAGLIGSFAFAVLFRSHCRYWSWLWFIMHMVCWCCIDYWHFHNLLKFGNIETSYSGMENPHFVSPYFDPDSTAIASSGVRGGKRDLSVWLPVWLMREGLALPIWVAAMCGNTIYWRNRPFRILPDLSTEEVRM